MHLLSINNKNHEEENYHYSWCIDNHKEFPGPQWGLTSIICEKGEKGDFNILPYAGEKVSIESSRAAGKFYQSLPLNLHSIKVNNKVICEYYAVLKTASLTPGIFAINDPNITSK